MAGYVSGSKRTVPIAGPLSVEIYAGQLVCLLGPNGSGKSTLLRTLAGLQSPLEGMVQITGIDAGKLKPAQLAKKISLVLTDPVRFSNLTVYSLVALGRYPYSSWLGILSETDKAIIAWAIEATGIEGFLQRKVTTLSDGESQKVMLARALAQDTPLMMLDEPTAHLDLPSRIQLMQLLHQLARQTNKGILISTHELDLAMQVADEVWLLQAGPVAEGGERGFGAEEGRRREGVGFSGRGFRGRKEEGRGFRGEVDGDGQRGLGEQGDGEGLSEEGMRREGVGQRGEGGEHGGVGQRGGGTGSFLHRGTPEDLVLNGTFEAAFDKEGIFFDRATGAFRIHQGNGKKITLAGEGVPAFWTRRALQRQGFTVADGQARCIRILEENGRTSWVLEYGDQRESHASIGSLLSALSDSDMH
jgi:ABC-type cobalamin/Fe3+-siderophores transport system ATPase subunit